MIGNNEKLYYSKGRKILEFSLSEADSLGFLLYLSGEKGAPMYPEVREAFSEGVIRQLQNEIVFGDHDVVTFSNGYLVAIDIKTPKTADVVIKKEGVTEQLKSDDWLGWLQKMNSIKSRVETVVLHDLIYSL